MSAPHPPDRAIDRPARLRREVGTFRAGEQRRRFPVRLHVGVLARDRVTLDVPEGVEPLDRATAFDLLDCRLDAGVAPEPEAWLTRPGTTELHDQDLLWLHVAGAVLEARGTTLASFHAVTRTGWLDVRTGETRVWKRLRLERRS